VGGSTRTPMVSEMLRSLLDLPPRMDVDPERAVALGAALHAARIGGGAGRILVDVTPFTFGTSYLGLLDGEPHDACFKGIIKRNTPLPTRQTEVFYTVVDGQQRVDASIYQGEAPDARDNLLIGRFMVDGLDPSVPVGSPVLFDLTLDTDGILAVEVTERHTGLKKGIVIEDAFRKLSDEEVAATRRRLRKLWEPEGVGAVDEIGVAAEPDDRAATTEGDAGETAAPEGASADQQALWSKAVELVEKARQMLPGLDSADREEVEEVVAALTEGLDVADFDVIGERADELGDILFYLE